MLGSGAVVVVAEGTDLLAAATNVLTFFNVVLGALILALLAIGEIKDGAFVGIVVVAQTLYTSAGVSLGTRSVSDDGTVQQVEKVT